MPKKDYITTMFEQICHQQLAILELVGATLEKVNNQPTGEDFYRLEAKVDTIEKSCHRY